jgi:hypothetical protein
MFTTKTGRWISQDLLEIHTAITDGDFRKAGILIGEKVEVNRMCADNTTILLQICQTIRKNETSLLLFAVVNEHLLMYFLYL